MFLADAAPGLAGGVVGAIVTAVLLFGWRIFKTGSKGQDKQVAVMQSSYQQMIDHLKLQIEELKKEQERARGYLQKQIDELLSRHQVNLNLIEGIQVENEVLKSQLRDQHNNIKALRLTLLDQHNSLPFPFYVVSREGHLLHGNSLFEKMCLKASGHTLDTVISLSEDDLFDSGLKGKREVALKNGYINEIELWTIYGEEKEVVTYRYKLASASFAYGVGVIIITDKWN